jgi:hypothetical protein
MTVDEIMNIVDECFANNIWTSVGETCLGIECHIEGRENFEKELRERLTVVSGIQDTNDR